MAQAIVPGVVVVQIVFGLTVNGVAFAHSLFEGGLTDDVTSTEAELLKSPLLEQVVTTL